MAIATPNTTLSSNDARILNALFDPETLPSSIARSKESSIIKPTLPAHPTILPSDLDALETTQNDLIQKITTSSSKSEIEEALRHEDEIMQQNPNYPSVYANRAMLRRMKLEAGKSKPDVSLFTASSEQDIEALFRDLSRAIHLSLPSSAPTDSVSPYQARILRTAFSHRAYLYLKAAESGVELKGKGKSELEELASGDFANAARYGDEVAREMSVRTNPYAKMCGAIVRNALAEERRDAGM
ncbi:hypothetical protein P280DRAFT_469249 [Massarina eburnea CBS 473.64]|uniref:Tetratricopeptide repeat protein 36 n=1 Tax=Massarina eburnea CBS 473.64 TaxID=1395130 RepID=A0A6A6RY65_9PLEO|nr:hypothetical protein P280DRAFT_469249 [Massarina eburnea CBS 473.64]